MDRKEIFSRVDHTLLYPVSTWEQIRTLCDQAMAYQAASVCIPPCYVKRAHDYVDGKMVICTVIGFPNGNMTP
ncbi:MAG: 2-deoxyribose-5-phosphate aldolase, partial [Clostridia bacterium]|nr:2-deoxyribose-5-phosphate aldolase [Clostridia bacterium]